MVDNINSSYNGMEGYMDNVTETYIIGLINDNKSTDQESLSIFSKFGVSLSDYGASWVQRVNIGPPLRGVSISDSGQYQTVSTASGTRWTSSAHLFGQNNTVFFTFHY